LTHNTRKATDRELVNAYDELRNIWRVAEKFSMCGQSVWERLKKLGVQLQIKRFTEHEIARIQETYYEGFTLGDGKFEALCSEIERPKTSVCRKARSMKLTNTKRKCSEQTNNRIKQRVKKWMKENEHPRGMSGKKHTQEVKEKLRKTSTEYWNKLSQEDKDLLVEKQLKAKLKKNGTLLSTPKKPQKVSWKQGWRKIGGKRKYYRSRWEANYARWLQWRKEQGEILKWEHEPETFWFEKIKRGCRSYLPDFKVTLLDGSHEWNEVKGWMDQRSITKIKRFRMCYPKETLEIIDAKWFKRNKNLAYIIKGWE